MDYNSIIKNYTEEEKENIVNLAKANKSKMGLHNEYDSQALNLFFDLWHHHFPNVRQSKTCRGCRKSVCQFFHNIADFIVETAKAVEPVETVAPVKKKAKKSKKAKEVKKHKTLTGALSPTGTRK
tara:strand:- start:674 stop:1048 length:375 start_codon:yes stop_codon:yes gene_type:complete